MSVVYVYVCFRTNHSLIETRVDENMQLVPVQTNNFMRVVCLSYPYNGILSQSGF